MPGCINNEDLWDVNTKRLARYMKLFLPFLQISPKSRCLDIGELNPKMEFIKKELGITVDQFVSEDFNFCKISPTKKYDVIFLLEVVEHCQNALHLMMEVKNALNDDGSIYVTTPCNPRWMWVDGHFFEMKYKHFKKWIIEPLGLKIVRHKKLYFVHEWRGIFIGFRPLVRVLQGKRDWISLIRTFAYFRYDIYEIKK